MEGGVQFKDSWVRMTKFQTAEEQPDTFEYLTEDSLNAYVDLRVLYLQVALLKWDMLEQQPSLS